MMAVVSLIGIMAALATPSAMQILKDRRSQRDANDIMLVLQDARARAFGRGAATRVQWDSSLGKAGVLRVDEALFDADGDNIGDLPSPSCGNTCNAGDATATCVNFWNATQSYWQVDTAEKRTVVQAHLNGSGTVLSTLAFCFTPQGRTYEWNGTSWIPNNKLYQFDIYTANNGVIEDSGWPRTVYLTPSGLARTKL